MGRGGGVVPPHLGGDFVALIRSMRQNKVQKLGPWRSKERVVRDGKLLYAVGALISREEAVRQGLVEEEGEGEKKGKRKSVKRET